MSAASCTVTGHEAIAGTLGAHGVDHVFGIGGTPVHETLAACARGGMRVVGVHHQQAAAFMSIAYNYASGRLASAVILSAGPAVSNVTTGLLVARDNGWPLMVLGGRRPISTRGLGAFQDLDAVALFGSITKHAELVASADTIVPALARARDIAMTHPPGPVYLDLTEEALSGRTAPPGPSPQEGPEGFAIDPGLVARAAELLALARRPALLLGDGLRWTTRPGDVARLVARLDAPFATTPIGRGVVSDDHPRACTAVRAAMLADADVVFIAGTRLDWMFRFGAELRRDATLIHAGADERGLGGTIPAALSLEGAPGPWLRAIADALERIARPPPDDEGWRARIDAARSARDDDPPARGASLPMTEDALVDGVRRWLPGDAFLAVDGNVLLEAAQRRLPSFQPYSRMTPGHDGCMGTGRSYAIGAKLARPGRPSVVVTGDLALGLGVMELETAVRLRTPVVVVVANNDGNGGGRSERRHYPPGADRVTMFGPGVRYDAIMRAVGGHGERVERPGDLVAALERAAAAGIAACVDVAIDVPIR